MFFLFIEDRIACHKVTKTQSLLASLMRKFTKKINSAKAKCKVKFRVIVSHWQSFNITGSNIK